MPVTGVHVMVTITAELAKGDPEALGDLQVLFDKTRRVSGSVEH
jgi:hypothetical protein